MSPLFFWLGIYLGGVIAIAMMLLAEALQDGEPIDWMEVAHALLWFILLPWYLIDVARGWRS